MNGRVVLGVTGSIAAYKSAELVRLLTKARIDVRVIMTRSGAEFLAPVTLATLTGHPVTIEMFGNPEGMTAAYGDDGADTAEIAPSRSSTDSLSAGSPRGDSSVGTRSIESLAENSSAEARSSRTASRVSSRVAGLASSSPSEENAADAASNVDHIRASRSADLIIVAPATANVLAKVAHGLADDALTTTILASSVPVLFAPAMNTWMWENAATRANLRLLTERGYRFADPGAGDLACGEYGAGRMAEPEEIAGLVIRALLEQRPEAPSLLVTTGGTEESIDPVRVITNRSSGRMGFAIAEAARDRGYRVTALVGRTSVPPPYGIEIVSTPSAGEMGRALARLHLAHDLLVMAAAVADYRPRRASARKIESGRAGMKIELETTPDLIAGLAGKRTESVTVGFALQTGGSAAEQLRSARAKLERKGLDLIVLNDPTRKGSQFGGEENEVTFVSPVGTEVIPRMSKREIGERLLDRAEQILHEKTAKSNRNAADNSNARPLSKVASANRASGRSKPATDQAASVRRAARGSKSGRARGTSR